MSTDRLTLARDHGLFAVPDGEVCVWGARAGTDLSAFPRDRLTVVATFRPDHDALAAAGYRVVGEAPERCDLAVVILSRVRAAARAMLAAASETSLGGVVVDGAKVDGIEGILRDLRSRATLSEALSKHHGKVAMLAPGADLSDWRDPGPLQIEGGFVTRQGLFSADGPDPGSALLADALPERMPARVADLGAGWGYLSRAILARDGVAELHLVEAERVALDCARLNLPDPRARFHWADATALAPADLGGPVDAIVTNPPFHSGRQADPTLGRGFIAAAARLLAPSGTLWLVANRHLPYEGALRDAFREVAEIDGAGTKARAFKLFRAARPQGAGRKREIIR